MVERVSTIWIDTATRYDSSLSLSLPSLAKNIDLDIDDVDYLRILEGGNFIHFVAIVYDAADKLSVVKTANYRLRVSPSQDPPNTA